MRNKAMQFNTLSVDDMIDVTTQLNQLLATERALLQQMKLRDIAPMQAEKERLSAQLISFQKHLQTDTTPITQADGSARAKFARLATELEENAEAAMAETRRAQSVNRTVMQTLVSAMAEAQKLGTYGSQGMTTMPDVMLSVNLNSRV